MTEKATHNAPCAVVRAAVAAVALGPAALTVYFTFNGGGFFAGSTGVAATVLGLALVLRVTLAEEPFAGFNTPLALTAGSLGLYAVWTLGSAAWSDAPARTIIDFDLALMYWLALVLFGSLPRRPAYVAWALRGLAGTIVAVCGAGLVTRVLPNLWHTAPTLANDRLSYPLTYWNALGLMAAVGLILCLHLTSSEREPPAARVLGAGAIPVLAATLYFTFSRGAIAACLLGLVVYIVVAHNRALLSAALALVLPLAAVLASAYGADRLATANNSTPAAVAQGHDVAIWAAVAVVAALVLRALLLPLDRRLVAAKLPGNRRSRVLAWAAAGAAMLILAIALGAPQRLSDQYDGFVNSAPIRDADGDFRERLTNPANNNRLSHWRVAMNGFRAEPLRGDGAGTYALRWARERDIDLKVENAHSLYAETLSELGLVGLVLLLVALFGVLAGFARRALGATRSPYAALLAAGVTWVLHAGVDWVWELPAVSVWFFCLGGLALAAAPGSRGGPLPRRFTRVAVGVGLLALVVTPALMALSQAHLNRSATALRAGDCGVTIEAALASISALSVRPDPFELLALCDARLGKAGLAIQQANRAVALDPASWRAHYVLGLAQASAGRDPRPSLRRSRGLNPRHDYPPAALRLFRTEDPQKWKRRARSARLPIE